MIKGLEALKDLKESCGMHMGQLVYILQEDKFDIIEKELKDYQEIKEIAKRYNWDDITSGIFNVKTDEKYRDLFNSAIVNIQEDYRKARALEIIKRFSHYDIHFLNYLLSEEKITKEEFDLLSEVLL